MAPRSQRRKQQSVNKAEHGRSRLRIKYMGHVATYLLGPSIHFSLRSTVTGILASKLHLRLVFLSNRIHRQAPGV